MSLSNDIPNIPVKRSEQGYVLITAIWLLILAGSIVAVVMLRTLSQAHSVKDQGTDLTDKLLLESAAETVFADRLFAGNKGNWWLVPASGQVAINGAMVNVAISSESGRLDLNEADPKLIDLALQGLGLEGQQRAGFAAELLRLRASGRRIGSFSELRAMVGQQNANDACLEDFVTLWSGLPQPRPDQMPANLAHALQVPTNASPSQAEAGAALRFQVSIAGRAPLVVVARPTGLREQPISVSLWENSVACSANP